MSTDYYFICHTHNKKIDMDTLCEAMISFPTIIKEHSKCDFIMGESSDPVCEFSDGYEEEYTLKMDKARENLIVKDEYKKEPEMAYIDFIDFYNKNRMKD